MADFRKMRITRLPELDDIKVQPGKITAIDTLNNVANVELTPFGAVSPVTLNNVPIFYHCQFYEKLVDSEAFTEQEMFSYGNLAFRVDDRVYVITYPGNVKAEMPAFQYIAGHIRRDVTPLCDTDFLMVMITTASSGTSKTYITILDVFGMATVDPLIFGPDPGFTFPCLYTTPVYDFLVSNFDAFNNPSPDVYSKGQIYRRNPDDTNPRDYVSGTNEPTPLTWQLDPYDASPQHDPNFNYWQGTQYDGFPYGTAHLQPQIANDSPYVYTGVYPGGSGYGKAVYEGLPYLVDGEPISTLARAPGYLFRAHSLPQYPPDFMGVRWEYTHSQSANYATFSFDYKIFLPWHLGGVTPKWHGVKTELGITREPPYRKDFPKLGESAQFLKWIYGGQGAYFLYIHKYNAFSTTDPFNYNHKVYYECSFFSVLWMDLCNAPFGYTCDLDGVYFSDIFAVPERSVISRALETNLETLFNFVEDDAVNLTLFEYMYDSNVLVQLLKQKPATAQGE